MYELTKKLKELTPYDPIQGDYKVRLDANESYIKISDEQIKAAVSGLSLNRYPDPYACETVKAFADLYGINPETVTAGNGSDELISIITACFLQKGEKILCFSHDFSMYAFYSSLYELDVCVMAKEPDLTIDVDKAIETAKRENVRAILFSNPCNPTSLGLKKADVKKLIENTNALVVLDEAYMDFWDEKESFLKDAGDYDNLLVLKTCSKALAMAGIRLGFAVANEKITQKLRAAKSPYNVNVVTQTIAAHFLKDKAACKERIEAVKISAKALYEMITALELPYFENIYTPVTNFVFIKTGYAEQIFRYMLDKSIAIRNMGAYLRISAGSAEENEAVIKALKEFKA